MALVIRLRRHGGRKKPFFRIVVADSRAPRDGRFVDLVGTYDPLTEPPKISLRAEKLAHWKKAGAVASSTVARLIERGQSTAATA